jgi:hypothetical protein
MSGSRPSFLDRGFEVFISTFVKITLDRNFWGNKRRNDVLIRLKTKNIDRFHFGM